MMQNMLEQSQPQMVTEKLKEAQKAGKVDMDIQQPTDKEQPIRMVVRPRPSPSQESLLIDQKTDLISSVETYRIEGGEEFCSPRPSSLTTMSRLTTRCFRLRDQLPADVKIADQARQVTGVAQGNLDDEQAAVQTAREFFQALIDKDYKKAGLVMGGQLAERYQSRIWRD